MSESAEAAREILRANRYVVLATVDADGPWVTPVWFAHRGLDVLLWVSRPDTRHSLALTADPRVAATVFDGSVEPGHGTAFYGRGRAAECRAAELDEHLAAYNEESGRQGLPAWTPDRVSGDGPFRLWVARFDELSLLTADGPDVRNPVEGA